MFDVKQAMTNIFTQIELYGRDGNLINYSLDVVEDNYGQQVLRFKHPRGDSLSHAVIILPFKTQTFQQRAQKLTDLDLLKAFKEIGNAAIREHNAKVMFDKFDRHEMLDNGYEPRTNEIQGSESGRIKLEKPLHQELQKWFGGRCDVDGCTSVNGYIVNGQYLCLNHLERGIR